MPVDGDRAADLRHAIALQHDRTEAFLERIGNSDRQRRAAHVGKSHARSAARLQRRLHQRGQHRRDSHEHRHAVALDRLEREARVEARHERKTCACMYRRVHAARHAEDM